MTTVATGWIGAGRDTRVAPPPLGSASALFLDIDGTLAELAPNPSEVRIDSQLARALPELAAQLGGALALVTGRTIGDADRLFTGLVLPIAGQHGCERRDASGTLHMHAPERATWRELRRRFIEFASRHDGLRIEDKGATLAIHYRQAPDLADHVHRTLRRAFEEAAPVGYVLQPGKCLLELRPGNRNKGTAIRDFMRERPFAGRRPVFVGDDRTDEHGFVVVDTLGGASVKVGPGATRARYRLDDIVAVRDWLLAPAAAWR